MCGKVFTQLRNMKQHERTIHEKSSTSFSCTECDYFTSRKHDLKHHMRKRHNNVAPDHNIPHKIARREPIPNIIDPLDNNHLLEQLEHEEIQTMLERNSQVGFGIMQITPTDESIPHEILQFFRDEQPWGTDQNLCPKLWSHS